MSETSNWDYQRQMMRVKGHVNVFFLTEFTKITILHVGLFLYIFKFDDIEETNAKMLDHPI